MLSMAGCAGLASRAHQQNIVTVVDAALAMPIKEQCQQ
jgi:hypothetical protein